MVNVRKRGNVYEYRAEIAPVDGKRKWISKSGFSSKKEANEKEEVLKENKELIKYEEKWYTKFINFIKKILKK